MKSMICWLTGLISITAISCKEVVDFYLGIPLQPVFEEDTFVPGLNLFGIIRPDSTGRYNNSFVMMQKAIQAVGSSDSLETDTVQVWIDYPDENTTLTCEFILADYEGIFEQEQYRPGCDFHPNAGDTLSIHCYYKDLPVLTSATIVPNAPVLREDSWEMTEQSFSFEIENDSSIHMLDVYAFSGGEAAYYQRIPAQKGVHAQVQMQPLTAMPDSVLIFGYDINLATYFLTSNTSLNFNKYREPYGTVENGYGVFGSLNLAVYRFQEK